MLSNSVKPLVTVNILSNNRREELKHTLQMVKVQSYKNIEIIVVDNASSDGSAEMIDREFPDVRLISRESNIGIAGWNEGFRKANGTYVLVLDDDSYPEKEAIEEAVKIFSVKLDAGIVACKVFNLGRKLYQSDFLLPGPLLDFVGCGALIKKSVFEEVGGFDPNIFIYAHEFDFSIRVINAGYSIEYCDKSIVCHRALSNPKEHAINNSFRYFNHSLSYVMILLKYLQTPEAQLKVSKFLINRFIVALFFGRLRDFFRLTAYLITSRPLGKIKRIKISKSTLALYNNYNLPFFDRQYFKGLITGSKKIILPFLYLSKLLIPLERKNKFIG